MPYYMPIRNIAKWSIVMPFGLESFKATPLGQQIGPVIEDHQNIADMIVLSRHDLPAVQVLGKPFLKMGLGPKFREHYARQQVGRWVKEVLAKRGLVPQRSARVSPGNLFSRGSIYKEQQH